MDPLFSFLLAHIFGDYAFQSDSMARGKERSRIRLLFHVLIYCLTIALFGWFHDLIFHAGILIRILPWLFPLFVIHALQDYIKSRFFNNSRQFYYLDQALHLAALYALRIIAGS